MFLKPAVRRPRGVAQPWSASAAASVAALVAIALVAAARWSAKPRATTPLDGAAADDALRALVLVGADGIGGVPDPSSSPVASDPSDSNEEGRVGEAGANGEDESNDDAESDRGGAETDRLHDDPEARSAPAPAPVPELDAPPAGLREAPLTAPRKAPRPPPEGVTDWRPVYFSPECAAERRRPVGRAARGEVGLGQRAMCVDANKTLEWKREIGGSMDVSVSHRVIYVPVMKAGTQMFQEVFKRRFGGTRLLDREVDGHVKRHGLKLRDFFVFTFVRNPLSMFRSAYGELSLYGAHNRIVREGFMLMPQTAESEPQRAMQALADVRRGVFAGLVPAHMFTQVWKMTRCLSEPSSGAGARRGAVAHPVVPFDFVGHLENADNDWRYVERRLRVPHEPLPVIHASDTVKERVWAKQVIRFAPASAAPADPFAELTRRACEYYRGDFACFGYEKERAAYCAS